MEHKAQTHFESLLPISLVDSDREPDASMYLENANVRHVVRPMYTAVDCQAGRQMTFSGAGFSDQKHWSSASR